MRRVVVISARMATSSSVGGAHALLGASGASAFARSARARASRVVRDGDGDFGGRRLIQNHQSYGTRAAASPRVRRAGRGDGASSVLRAAGVTRAAAAAKAEASAESGVDVVERLASASPAHDAVERWIVFSDLHVSKRTMETCKEVLQKVHDEAVATRAGVLFLGDFWHARGAIPVEPLNEALALMSSTKWTAPTIMIPGNHDQVTAGGYSHALTPLAASNANILVFDGPTLYNGALWLPYRRNADVLKRAIQDCRGEFNAIFCHADVVGASMNETFQARDGLDPALFGGANTYTGHYHKPHVVPNTKITYVGSPYEVSRSEAGQTKELLILDTKTWTEGDHKRIALDIGPKHFAVDGAEAAVPPSAKPGDVIRWTIPIEAMDAVSDAVPPAVRQAREQGYVVEVCYVAKEMPARIPRAEELGPAGLFDAYATASDMAPNVSAFGRDVLQEVAAGDDAPVTRRQSSGITVSFDSVEVEGFGTFQAATRYPLASRGVCVVVGENRTDTCSDSNGAGKTTLVMSPMWALTGQSDLRIDGGGSGKSLTKSDVVNDAAKFGRVRLEGFLNGGTPFWVERKVNKTKLVSLKYAIGDEEKTMAEAKLTQQGINDDIGADVIANTTFHGQHTVGALLDANDASLKAALGKLVEADTWTKAKDISRKRVSEARTNVNAIVAEVKAREEYISRTRARLERATVERDSWDDNHARRLSALEASTNAVSTMFIKRLSLANHYVRRLHNARMSLESASRDAERALDGARRDAEGAAARFDKKETELEDKLVAIERDIERLNDILRDLQAKEASAGALGMQAHAAVGMFAGVGAANNGNQPHEHTGVGTCDRCLQPIDPKHHKETLVKLKEDARTAALAHGKAIDARAAAAEALRKASDERRKLNETAALARKSERMRAESAASVSASATDALRHAQRALSLIANALTRAEALTRSAPEDALERANGMSIEDAIAPVHAMSGELTSPASSSGVLRGLDPELLARPKATSSMTATKTALSPNDADIDVTDSETIRLLVASAEDAIAEGERAGRDAARRVQEFNDFKLGAHANPHASALEELERQLASEGESLEARVKTLDDAKDVLATAQAADSAFSTKGIQSYLFEGALGDLSARVGQYMDALTGGALTLELRPAGAGFAADDDSEGGDGEDVNQESATAAGKRTKASTMSASAAERIERVIHARRPDGSLISRTLRQLSGGERRRAALALALAYADLASERCGVACDTLVLDEVLQHLDAEGIARVTSLLRALPKRTVLLTSQADSATAHLFDVVDKVVKTNVGSGVVVSAGEHAMLENDGDAVEA